MTAYRVLLDALRANGKTTIERSDSRATATCPAHDDNRPSLSLARVEGSVLVYCHAGCRVEDVLAAVGLGPADMFDNRRGAAYRYPGGRVVHRKPDKSFPQSGNKTDTSLFHADRIGDACLVYVTEGEKDVLAIESAGGTAVCAAMGAGKAHKFDWSPLTDLNVIVVADRDEAGRKHALQVAKLLADVASSVQIKQAAAGKDAADHVAAGLALHEFVDLPSKDAPAAITLEQAHAVFTKWLGGDYDTDAIDAVLATLAAEQLDGDPLWLLLISGPGNAKTETVGAASGVGAVITSTISSDAGLLSATPARERAKDATGGLLRKLEPRGVLVVKDVTSVLSMDRNLRGTVLAALREVHDGSWYRDVGTDGGQRLQWKGRIAVIGACTTAWDAAHAVVSTMGDRFVLVRMDSTVGRAAAGRKAIRNTGDETTMRAELAAAVGGVIAGMSREAIAVTDAESDRILEAADLVTLARTGVEYDYRGDVIDAHAPEMPTRFAKQLAQLVRGAVAIGMDRTDALRLAIRCARDSMPPLRLLIIDDLAEHPHSTASDVRKRIKKPRATVDRQLQALHMLAVCECDEEEYGADKIRWYYSLAPNISPDALDPKSLPDLLVHTPNPIGELSDNTSALDSLTHESGEVSDAGLHSLTHKSGELQYE